MIVLEGRVKVFPVLTDHRSMEGFIHNSSPAAQILPQKPYKLECLRIVLKGRAKVFPVLTNQYSMEGFIHISTPLPSNTNSSPKAIKIQNQTRGKS